MDLMDTPEMLLNSIKPWRRRHLVDNLVLICVRMRRHATPFSNEHPTINRRERHVHLQGLCFYTDYFVDMTVVERVTKRGTRECSSTGT